MHENMDVLKNFAIPSDEPSDVIDYGYLSLSLNFFFMNVNTNTGTIFEFPK